MKRTDAPSGVRRMNAIRSLQCVVYLITALVLGYLTYMSLMWGVWGAPVYPTHFIALLGALGLFVSALVSLGWARTGRTLAVVSLAALGTFWVPGVISLVPQHNIIVSPIDFFVVGLYFGAVGFALLYPVRWRWSVPAFVLVLSTAVTLAAVTAIRRFQSGEYARPSFAYFKWSPSGNGLTVERDLDGWIDSETKALLQRSGIRGKLEGTGSSGARSAAHRVILLAQRAPGTSYQLRYPRVGTLIYTFDGSLWRMIPSNAATYSSYATIEPQGSSTMLREDVGGGRQGTAAFVW